MCSENYLFSLSSGRITFYTQPPEDRSTISATICTELGEAFDINAGTLQGVCVSVHVLQGVWVSVHILQDVWVSVHVTSWVSVQRLQGVYLWMCYKVHGCLCMLQGGKPVHELLVGCLCMCHKVGGCLCICYKMGVYLCMLQGGCVIRWVHVCSGCVVLVLLLVDG